MVTIKPKRDYVSLPFHVYNPSGEELAALVKTIERHTNVALDDEFAETVRRLLILFRKQMDIQENVPSKEAQYVELRQLKKAIRGLDNILSKQGMSEPLFLSFEQLKIRHQLGGIDDPIHGIRLHMHNLLKLCNEIEREFIDNASKKLTLAEFRDIVAEELARALDKAGYKPTATREGPFEKAFEDFMKTSACEVQGRKLSAKTLKDAYAVIRRAVKSYPTKDKYPLLEVKMLPGLTG